MNSNQIPFVFNNSAVDLQAWLVRLTGKPVALSINSNRVRMVSFHWKGGICHLRLNKAFLSADKIVISALAGWLTNIPAGIPPIIRQFIAGIEPEENCRTTRKPIIKKYLTHGKVFDLRKTFDEVNQCYFDGKVHAEITWGLNKSRRAIKIRQLGSFNRRLNLITIHNILDNPRVPEMVISFVMYHEMLHALQAEDCRHPHGTEFRRAERLHPDYNEVKKWEKDNAVWLARG